MKIEINSKNLTGKNLLEKLDIGLFAAVIEKNNVIVPESEILTDKDDIKILNMIHGG